MQQPGEVVLGVMLEGVTQLPGEVAPLRPNDAVLMNSPRGETCVVESPQGTARVAVVRLTTR